MNTPPLTPTPSLVVPPGCYSSCLRGTGAADTRQQTPLAVALLEVLNCVVTGALVGVTGTSAVGGVVVEARLAEHQDELPLVADQVSWPLLTVQVKARTAAGGMGGQIVGDALKVTEVTSAPSTALSTLPPAAEKLATCVLAASLRRCRARRSRCLSKCVWLAISVSESGRAIGWPSATSTRSSVDGDIAVVVARHKARPPKLSPRLRNRW